MSSAKKPAPTLMHNLGEFVGHVVAGITSDVTQAKAKCDAEPVVVREQVQEHEHVTPEGQRLILRRRTIDEMVVTTDGASAAPGDRKAAEI